MERAFFVLGAIFGALAVAAGAFGAHALKRILSADALGVFEVGVRYMALHGLALLAVAWASGRWPGRAVAAAGWCFVAGIVLFSGSLVLLALTGVRALGAATPVGGLALIGGWLSLAAGAATGKRVSAASR